MSRLVESMDKELMKVDILSHTVNLMKDCQPFLKDLMKSRKWEFMYSGRDGKSDVFKGKVRTNRKPTDTNRQIHNDLDTLFQKRFGYPARSNSVFCSGLESIAESYGTTYMIFPIGRYKHLYSEDIDDLYMAIASRVTGNVDAKKSNGLLATSIAKVINSDEFRNEEDFDEYYDRVGDGADYEDFYERHYNRFMDELDREAEKRGNELYWETLQEMVDTYTDKDINSAIYAEGEIMITCKEYWGIKSSGDGYYTSALLRSYFKKFGANGHKGESDFESWWSIAKDRV